jgi:uncharacterized protein YigA (DUF484 family)
MSIENTITNTKTVADSFVNDQLKWRRERIEDLTRELAKSRDKADNYKKLYENELDIVSQFIPLLKLIEKDNDLDFKVVDTLKKHLERHNFNTETL